MASHHGFDYLPLQDLLCFSSPCDLEALESTCILQLKHRNHPWFLSPSPSTATIMSVPLLNISFSLHPSTSWFKHIVSPKAPKFSLHLCLCVLASLPAVHMQTQWTSWSLKQTAAHLHLKTGYSPTSLTLFTGLRKLYCILIFHHIKPSAHAKDCSLFKMNERQTHSHYSALSSKVSPLWRGFVQKRPHT